MSLPLKIGGSPTHVAVIMDGNGRWARQRGLPRLEGHRQGIEVVDRIVTHAVSRGVSFLTLYAFSIENWARPKQEVDGLMHLLCEFLLSKKDKLLREGVRLTTIGDLSQLPPIVQETLMQIVEVTSVGTAMTLVLALSYGGRDELIRACRKMAQTLPLDEITETRMTEFLDTREIPDPDFVLRTSGEQRLSNFLLWQSAYAELIFTDVLWPDFTELHFDQAILEFKRRERRFGRTTEI